MSIYTNALTHLITLLLYYGLIHCMVLLCVQYNVKYCCLFSGWFANEANVATNKRRLATISCHNHKDEQERYSCSETGRDIKHWRPRIQEHTINKHIIRKVFLDNGVSLVYEENVAQKFAFLLGRPTCLIFAHCACSSFSLDL